MLPPIPVFEPNLFSLLAGGGSEDQKVSFEFFAKNFAIIYKYTI